MSSSVAGSMRRKCSGSRPGRGNWPSGPRSRASTERPEEPGKHWVYHEKSQRDPGEGLIRRIENIALYKGENTGGCTKWDSQKHRSKSSMIKDSSY
jgi:hypothetical protein